MKYHLLLNMDVCSEKRKNAQYSWKPGDLKSFVWFDVG